MKINRVLHSGLSLCIGLVAILLYLVLIGWEASSIRVSTAQASSPEMVFNSADDIDLDVTFINREPLYQAYCVDYHWDIPGQPGIPFLCPGTEDDRRWPDTGEIVTFTAHIINKGNVTSPPFGYAWHIDGEEVANGTLPALAPAEAITTTYQWPWGHEMSPDGQQALGDHSVRFTADPTNAIPEMYESNNTLEDPTNAMSFRFYFTPAMHTAYNTPVDPQWPASGEDWIQKQIAMMNWDFANSTYPVAPDGVTVRVRIDQIGVSETNPAGTGHDGGWFIDADYRHGASGWYDPATDIDWALIHEMSHQVAIIDLYSIGAEAPNVLVTDRLGNPLNVGFSWPRPDLMGGGDIWPHTDGHLYSSHVAGGASTYKGYRNGYYGSYLFDIPLENYLLVLDSLGNPAPDVEVALYQRNGTPDWTGAPAFDAPPDISGTTNTGGIFLLTNRPVNGGTVTDNGHVLHDNPFGVIDIIGSQNLFLVQLRQGNHEEYHWLDITEFNLAYWMGDTISHTFVISSHVPPPTAPPAPLINAVQVKGYWTKICWQESPSPDVTGYRLYRATAPMSVYELVAEVESGPCLEDSYSAGSYGGKIYAMTARNETGLESGFSNFSWAPTLLKPMSLVSTSNGENIILDPRNGYALIRQAANGGYQQYIGSVHFHLENSQFMALDANNHLIFSHPGDWYTARHSVRVAELNGTPLLEFGEQGSGPGQFETPTGVAGWGEASTFGGPYEPDKHSSLLLHLDGSYDGAEGEPGTPYGTTFVAGHYGPGVLVDDNDTLSYTATGNITSTQGAVEFWLRPNWNGDDGGNHTLFWWGEGSEFFHLRKDGISNLVFDRFFEGGSCGAPVNVSDWNAGEWHHLAFTWDGTYMVLYVDGQSVAQTMCEGVAKPTASIFYIGSGIGGDLSVDGIIDEFRISDMPRFGNSDTSGLILVADSGNHRIQAFDNLGNFISQFGTYGNNDGQFDNPQGLAVDLNGRVIVVDRGNNRLVTLSFDGQVFTYLDSYTAGFSNPTSVAVDDWGNLVVADTGNNRIVVLDAQGIMLTEYYQPNDSYTGSFNAPRGVTVDQNGNFVVADTGNSRVVSVHRLKRTWLPLVIYTD
jgi:hypothetical protein